MKENTRAVGLGEKTTVGCYFEHSKGKFKQMAYTNF